MNIQKNLLFISVLFLPNLLFAQNPLIGKRCTIELDRFPPSFANPQPLTFSAPYSSRDIKLMDKIINHYCKMSFQTCTADFEKFKKTGRFEKAVINPYLNTDKNMYGKSKCLEWQWITHREPGIATCYTRLAESWNDSSSNYTPIFYYDIPELKNSDFEGCLQAKKLCEVKLQKMKASNPNENMFCGRTIRIDLNKPKNINYEKSF